MKFMIKNINVQSAFIAMNNTGLRNSTHANALNYINKFFLYINCFESIRHDFGYTEIASIKYNDLSFSLPVCLAVYLSLFSLQKRYMLHTKEEEE